MNDRFYFKFLLILNKIFFYEFRIEDLEEIKVPKIIKK